MNLHWRVHVALDHLKWWTVISYTPLKALRPGWGSQNQSQDHLPKFIHKGASNLHPEADMEDKIKLLDPHVQHVNCKYLEVLGSCPLQ